MLISDPALNVYFILFLIFFGVICLYYISFYVNQYLYLRSFRRQNRLVDNVGSLNSVDNIDEIL
jgi:hypothetical protein